MATLFLSDLHFGDGGPSDDFGDKDDKLVQLLLWAYQVNPEVRVVLVGDILDTRETTLDKIMVAHERCLTMLFAFTAIYVVGNHDDNLLGEIVLGVEGVESASYKGVLIEHGHLHDWFEKGFPWAGRLVSRVCAWMERNIHSGFDDWALRLLGLTGKTGRTAKNAKYDLKAVECAVENDCHTVIYGHTHEFRSSAVNIDGISIYNSGTWVGDNFDYLLLDV